MLRAAAKNFLRVAAVSSPESYTPVGEELEKRAGALTLESRFALARAAFAHTRKYEEAISSYFDGVAPEALRRTYQLGVHGEGRDEHSRGVSDYSE